MGVPAMQKAADLRGEVFAVANPGSAGDFAAKLFLASQGLKSGQGVSLIYNGSTSGAFAALRPYIAKQPGRMRAFVAGITEAIAYIHRRPNEAKAV